MERAKAALIVSLSALLLSSCSPWGSLSGEQKGEDSENNARGLSTDRDEVVEADSGEQSSLPPLGDFDPNSPDFELFDPCTEISEESLQRAKLGPPEEFLTPTSMHRACAFKDLSGGTYVEIIINSIVTKVNDFPAESFEERAGVYSDSNSELTKAFKFAGDADNYCTPARQTVRGTIFLNIADEDLHESVEQTCDYGFKLLETM